MRATLVLSLLLIACGGTVEPIDASGTDSGGPADAGTEPASVFYDPLGTGFFDTPFPSDLRTDDRGHPDLAGFPRARGIVADGIELVQGDRPGFSPLTSVYFRFTGALDDVSLPDVAAAAMETSLVSIVDIDPASDELGRRMPAYVRFQRNSTQFFAPNTLIVRPVPGLGLHPGRRYAFVVRDGLRASDGSSVARNDAFEALKAGGDSHHTELFEALEGVGIPRAEVLVASMVSTSDPALDMDHAHAFIAAQELPPVTAWSLIGQTPRVASYEAVFETYELLSGEAPYTTFGSANIRFDADGVPEVVNRLAVRVAISVPTTPMPAEGYPIILYGHGTGGDHQSHLRSEGVALARVGWAMIGFEAALHGDRNPAGFDEASLLLSNPIAAREIVRQTVVDMLLLFRMLAAGSFVVPASVSDAADIRFDASRVAYMGHSQGSQEAGVLLGVEPTVQAAFLSEGGAGGTISIVDRDLSPGMPIACVIASIVGEMCAAMTEDHPVLTQVIQPMLDPADPFSFTHRFLRERPDGWSPVSIAMTEGLEDTDTPPRAIEAMAASIGLPIVEPLAQATDPYAWLGMPTVSTPVRSNLAVGDTGAMVTGGLMQWAGEGHFVIYRNDDAERRYVEFFRTWLEDGEPTIVGPL